MTVRERYQKYLDQYLEAVPRVEAADPKWVPEMSQAQRHELLVEVHDIIHLLKVALKTVDKDDSSEVDSDHE